MVKKKRMYNLTYRVRKQLPDLRKKRTERIFLAQQELALKAIGNRSVKCLINEFGFGIQITL